MNITVTRRITQILFVLLVFLIPVFDIFRFDSASGALIVLGKTWRLGLKDGFYMDKSALGSLHIAIRFFLRAILPWLAILSIFPILGLISGRLFCGWLCPEGALFEWADYLTTGIFGRRSLYKKGANDPPIIRKHKWLHVLLAVTSIIVIPFWGGIALTGYFIAPRTIWHQLLSWNFTFGVKAGILGVALYMVITSIFIRHALCKYICAAGLMQMLFGWISPVSLRLMMDSSRIHECTNCHNCERACFMNLVPRKDKRDISCVNCGACIEACRLELGREKGLFCYQIGKEAKTETSSCNYVTPAKQSDSCLLP